MATRALALAVVAITSLTAVACPTWCDPEEVCAGVCAKCRHCGGGDATDEPIEQPKENPDLERRLAAFVLGFVGWTHWIAWHWGCEQLCWQDDVCVCGFKLWVSPRVLAEGGCRLRWQLMVALALAATQIGSGGALLSTMDHGWGIAHLIIGCWGAFWCLVPLSKLCLTHQIHPELGTWTEHRDIDMCGQGDVEIIGDWRKHTSIEELKRKVEEKGYSAVTVSSEDASFNHAALKKFPYQLTPEHCKPISQCCRHPCTIYIYRRP